MGKDGVECPAVCPTHCNPEDQMSCWGGKDDNECDVADFCIPNKGPVGVDGFECAAMCPMKCGPETMQCPGGVDSMGCPMPDTCPPSKGEFIKAHRLVNLSDMLFCSMKVTQGKMVMTVQ